MLYSCNNKFCYYYNFSFDEFNLSFKYLANKEYLLDVNLILDIVKIVHKIDKKWGETEFVSNSLSHPITMVNYNNKYHIPIFDLIVFVISLTHDYGNTLNLTLISSDI